VNARLAPCKQVNTPAGNGGGIPTEGGGESGMWHGFDPETQRLMTWTRDQLARSRQTPTREWPLVVVDEHDALLVIREWPDGAITAYTADTGPR
jgi:hypothetical protein